jgi:peptidoglycan/LPS O-acetylase OafA/YrhL
MKQHIPSLDGLRALSIICVLISHIQSRSFHKQDAMGGQIGVTIFFVISGYLITRLLLQEERTYGYVSLTNFYIRRSLRIFPAYYLLLFVYFLLQLAGVLTFTSASWLSSLTYTKYFPISGASEWETGHFWSLSIEEHFYLVWPFAFAYLKPYRIHFAITIIALCVGFRLLSTINAMNLLTRADAIMTGALFAFYNRNIQSALTRYYRLHPFTLIAPFVGILFCIGFKRVLSLPDSSMIVAFVGSYGLMTNVCIGLIILISITFPKNAWYRLLNLRIVSQLGLFSYSLYLWQQLFFSSHLGVLSSFPLNIFLIVIIAMISYYLIEQPFLRLKARFIKHQAVVGTDKTSSKSVENMSLDHL